MSIKPKTKSIIISLVLILFFGLYVRNLFHGQLFRSDDLELHGARLANFYLALKQGQIPPRWAPNLNYNFGYPVFTVSYMLPYALAVVWYMAGLSIEWSLNLATVCAIGIMITGFIAIGVLRKKILQGIIAGLLFATAPYILATIFIRGAIAETLFLSFIPWMIFGIDYYRLIKPKPWMSVVYPVIIAAFLMTHPPSLVFGLPIIGGYLVLNIRKHPHLFQPLALNWLIGILLAQFFWVPFLVEKNYVIAGHGFSTADYFKRFPKISELLWSKWSYGGLADIQSKEHFTYRIGVGALVVVITALFYKTKFNLLGRFWLIVFFIAAFLLTPYSKPIWDVLWPMQSVQFPWRLLWIPSFAAAQLVLIPKASNFLTQRTWQIITGAVILIALHHAVMYTKPAGYISNSNHDWLNYSLTSSTNGEFNPIWFDSNLNLKFVENLAIRPKDQSLIDQNGNRVMVDAQFNIDYWDGTMMKYSLVSPVEGDVIQKTAYFPGFEVRVNNQTQPINFKDSEFPGRIIFSIPKGAHQVEVKFTQNTWDRNLGSLLSMIGVILLMYRGMRSLIKHQR